MRPSKLLLLSSRKPIMGGMAAWFRKGVGITSDSGAVSTWADQTGFARHLVQATGSAQPTAQADGSVLFDGSNDYMNTAAFALAQPLTVYLVMKQVTWGGAGQAHFIDGAANNTMAIWAEGSTPAIDAYAGARIGNNYNLAVDTWGVVCAVFNGASSLLQVDDTTPTTGDCGSGIAGGIALGAAYAGTANANIQVKELIVYSDAHDAGQRFKNIRYLSGL